MKKGNMVSENESMLVSEGKWTPQVSPCNCQRRLSVIEDKIECMSLKIDEISSNLNISFTKHMETYGKLVQEQKQIQNIEYVVWQLKEVSQSNNEKINNDLKKKNMQIVSLGEEFKGWNRMLREIKSWKANQCNSSSSIEKQVFESLRKSKSETDQKLKKMFQAVEEIGLLQRKMLKENQPQMMNIKVERPASRMKQMKEMKERKSLPAKNHSTCNESTMIGNSRYYYI